MVYDHAKFWNRHNTKGVSEEFKSLAALLLAPEPGSRPTMADVLGHAWMRGETASQAEFSARFSNIMDEAQGAREEDQAGYDVDYQIASAGTRRSA